MIRFLCHCILPILLFSLSPHVHSEKVVHVYGWYGSIDRHLMDKFYKETGIRVIMDYVDNNDVLEAKLLMGKTGYDVVFPSAWPYASRQIPAGLYHPIDQRKIPHYKGLDPEIMERLKTHDPGNLHLIPFAWGLVGMGYNIDKVLKIHSKTPLGSWATIYDPEWASKFQKCGISLLEEPIDVIIPYYIYRRWPLSHSTQKLKEALAGLQKIRPFIHRFDGSGSSQQWASGETCIVQQWTCQMALARFKERKNSLRENVRIILPKEGTTMWIDVMAIPKDAPHKEEAHIFINFLLHPDHAAYITNISYCANGVKSSKAKVKEEIQKNSTIYPPSWYMKKVIMGGKTDYGYQRAMTRTMFKLVSGR